MRTGRVVGFRNLGDFKKNSDKAIPLFYGQHIQDGHVFHFPFPNKDIWISNTATRLFQPNKDSVFLKRFTSKEEKRRLQPGIYTSSDYYEYDMIGTDNKLNYIEKIDGGDIAKNELLGIFALFNSTRYDEYYRILDGSTQVNSSEINSLPVPDIESIIRIGGILASTENMDTSTCDRALECVLNI
jgi:adenine-specific DNA-methyltransferase